MPRILVIDDDVSFRSMLCAALEQMGHEVKQAVDGEAGIESYKAERFDVVMTDLIMPGKEGIETIMELRSHDPRVKIIAMSGGGRINAIDYLRIARQVGAKKTLAKPFDYEDIRLTIEALLEADAKNPPTG